MSDSLFSKTETNATPASNVAEYSVSEISTALKKTVEDQFGYVRVRGEISGFRGPHSSGHCYFALKDDRARLEAVIWRGVVNRLKHMPEEGLEVIASGKLTTYPGSSKYQIMIDSLEPAGAGALMALLEERKKKLEAEGLFDPARKQLLPYIPRVIGVVTSPTGAVIRDILHRLHDRFPVHVLVWPVRVQGDTTGTEVSTAIRGFNSIGPQSAIPRPDLLIVARGGGSIEDLWGFNDEAVVRAAAESDIPLISAVGHETDWTLIDYASDQRAPTPTGAAEMAVPVKADLEAHLAQVAARLRSSVSRRMDRSRTDLKSAERGLATPEMLLAAPAQRLDQAAARLTSALVVATEVKKGQFQKALGRGLPRPQVLFRAQGVKVEDLRARLDRGFVRYVENRKEKYKSFAGRLSPNSLRAARKRGAERLIISVRRMVTAHKALADQRQARFLQASRLIESLSHKRVLSRGFALVRDVSGTPVFAAEALAAGDAINIEFRDGAVGATITNSQKSSKDKKPPEKKQKQLPPDKQGSLF